MGLLQNTDAVELESNILLEHLRRVYRPDCDYIDGEVRERNAGYCPHSEMIVIVGSMLHGFAKAAGTVALLSVRVRVSEDCVLVPGICLARRTQSKERVIVTPPLLCVEIITDADRFVDLENRALRFHKMGVDNVWFINDRGTGSWVVTLRGFERPADGVLRVAGTAIAISITDVFSELTKS